jgi:hypothetical protein
VNRMQHTACTISCWMLPERGDRERVNNEGWTWLKHDRFKPTVPGWTPLGLSIYAFKKRKDRRVKQLFSRGGYQWEGMGTGTWGMRVKKVDVFCIHIWKWKNETCWNCSKKGRGEVRTMERVNLTKIHCTHVYKYYNVFPCTTLIC